MELASGSSPSIVHLLTVILVCWRCDGVLIHHDYHIEVTTTCPETPDEPALVTITTDMFQTYPYAICEDDYHYEFARIDASTYMLEVMFNSNNTDFECCFIHDGNEYTLNTYVPESSGIIYGNEEPRPVSCIFGEGEEEPDKRKGLQPIEQLSTFMGVVGDSDVRLSVVDIDGNEITGNLALGRYVKLKAWLIGNYSSEVSFQAVSCEAISSPESYMFLIGGCGDGTILKHESGFVTSGKFAESPFFKVFYLDRSAGITFNCSFVLCSNACDGNSCEISSRRKRGNVKKESYYISRSLDSAVPFSLDVDNGIDVEETPFTDVADDPQLTIPDTNMVVVDMGRMLVMVTLVPMVFMMTTAMFFICVIAHILQKNRRPYIKNVGLKDDCSDI